MSIVVTNKCNRKCAYCINSSTDGKSDLPLNKALTNIRKAHDNLGIKECVILGGEPTLYPDLSHLKVNTIKCLVTGDLSLSWNTNNIVNI